MIGTTPMTRREMEFAEFLNVKHKWLVDTVHRVDMATIEVRLNDTSICTITRSLDFSEPPRITRNGMTYLSGEYTYCSENSLMQWFMLVADVLN